MKDKGRQLSYLLRHDPKGLDMDGNGWVTVADLLKKINISMDELERIVSTNNKRRFSFNNDRTSIRANQGHSINVDIELKKRTPPKYLYHGTASRNIRKIKKFGLSKMRRNHVHLSADHETAMDVAKRYCKNDVPYIFMIDTTQMMLDGINFFLSENGVWLVDHVDPKFL